jgi:hypothetical protein
MSGTNYSILHVYTENPHNGLQFISRVYEGTINITGGSGGWQSVPRPLNDPVSVWRGPQTVYTMEIPLVFDVYDQPGADIEDRCRTLELMCGTHTSPVAQPPLLVLNANGGIPNDVYNFPPLRWVVPDDPVWGDQLRNENGRRSRQVVTVKFMKYAAYDELTRSKNAQQSKPNNTTVARGGDTFNKIAARDLKQYGGVRWGNRLAQLNGARDGAAKPQPGQLVRLPTTQDIKQWQSTARR